MFEGLRKPRTLVVNVVTRFSYGCPIQVLVQTFGLDSLHSGKPGEIAWESVANKSICLLNS